MFLAKLFNSEKRDDAVNYISSITRSITIMLDLILIILVLMSFSAVFHYIISFFYQIPWELIQVSNLGGDLTDQENAQVGISISMLLILQLIQLALVFFYFTIMWSKFSTTPGKFLFGIRLVDAKTFERITFKRAAIRCISIPLSIIPVGLGIVWAVFDRKSQAWHDKLANTVLIVKNIED